MKTYTAYKGGEYFDWNKFLKNAIRRKTDIPSLNIEEIKNISRDWVTCACGNQCAAIPRDLDGEPKDKELAKAGARFHSLICSQSWEEARNTLRAIERRSKQLLTEIQKESVQNLRAMGYKVTLV